jgi:hypothetical protein
MKTRRPPSASPDPSSPSAHVRGTGAYRARAGFAPLLGARVIDASLALFALFAAHRALRMSPVPHWGWIAGSALLLGALWASGRLLSGRSPGEAAWRLRTAPKTEGMAWDASLRMPLLQPGRIGAPELAGGAFLTLAAVIACAWSIDRAVFKQPLWARARPLELDAYLPDMSARRWEVLPFFYTLGAWPREYAGKPVFYSLPYEKGPPTRFIGHMSARWEAPGTIVTFEGPKTPASPVTRAPGERTPRDRIRECLLGSDHSWACLKIREVTLLRHLTEVQHGLTGRAGGDTALSMRWQLRWFTVRNPALAPSEQAQGIYISAEDKGQGGARGPARGEERYVLITENGTHQAISLTYPDPRTPAAMAARETFAQAIRSLRASDDLGPGRAWADSQLKALALGDIGALLSGKSIPPGIDAAKVIQRLGQAQALLLSKISVQPGTFDSYFHLGGTALLLDRLARKGSRTTHLEGLELAAASKPLVQAAYRYAQDVAPDDARTTQLHGFWIEAQRP